MGLNSIIISGNLASEIDRYFPPDGTPKCSFRIAVQRQFKENDKHNVDFMTVVCWAEQAEFISRSAHKGDAIEVKGVLRQIDYKNYEVKAEQVELIRRNGR